MYSIANHIDEPLHGCPVGSSGRNDTVVEVFGLILYPFFTNLFCIDEFAYSEVETRLMGDNRQQRKDVEYLYEHEEPNGIKFILFFCIPNNVLLMMSAMLAMSMPADRNMTAILSHFISWYRSTSSWEYSSMFLNISSQLVSLIAFLYSIDFIIRQIYYQTDMIIRSHLESSSEIFNALI